MTFLPRDEVPLQVFLILDLLFPLPSCKCMGETGVPILLHILLKLDWVSNLFYWVGGLSSLGELYDLTWA